MANSNDSITVDVLARRFRLKGVDVPLANTRTIDAPGSFVSSEPTVPASGQVDLDLPAGGITFLIIVTDAPIDLYINGTFTLTCGSFIALPDTVITSLSLKGKSKDAKPTVWTAKV